MRGTLFIIAFCALSSVALGQGRLSGPSTVRWLTTVNKAKPGQGPGEFVLIGDQNDLRLRITVGNTGSVPLHGVDGFANRLRAQVTENGVPLETRVDVVRQGSWPSSLEKGDGFDATLILKRADNSSLGPGTYSVAIELGNFLDSLIVDSGSSAGVVARATDVKRIIIRPIETGDDLAEYSEAEGNAFLGEGLPDAAIPHLERLTQLRPDDWHALATLGSAYLRVGRFNDAIAKYQQALPGWARVRDRIGDIVPTDLARAYVAVGREAEARGVLRQLGLSEQAVTDRINTIRRRQ